MNQGRKGLLDEFMTLRWMLGRWGLAFERTGICPFFGVRGREGEGESGEYKEQAVIEEGEWQRNCKTENGKKGEGVRVDKKGGG
jgi:hypothetical protein